MHVKVTYTFKAKNQSNTILCLYEERTENFIFDSELVTDVIISVPFVQGTVNSQAYNHYNIEAFLNSEPMHFYSWG